MSMKMLSFAALCFLIPLALPAFAAEASGGVEGFVAEVLARNPMPDQPNYPGAPAG
jgi:hypothetical protein